MPRSAARREVSVLPRLTFVCSTLAFGGAERMWSVLVPALAARGFPVQVLTLVEEGAFFHRLQAQGIPAACAHLRRRSDLRGLRRAFRFLDSGTDLVISQSVNAQTVGAVLAWRAGVPHVTIDHAGPGLQLRWHQRVLLRGVARSVDLLLAPSALQLQRLVPLGFAPSRIRIIPNGVEPLVPTETRAETRARLGLGAGEAVALLVADLRPVKQAHEFVVAVAEARAREPRLRGLIAGDGPERATVTAAALQSDGAVELLGERTDVADLMNAADVVCLTSRTEGQPISLLEAMSLAKPVLAPAVGGIPELVLDETTGLLVPAGNRAAFVDALVRLARDEPLRLRLGKAARDRHREHFDAASMVEAYAAAFTEVVECRRVGGRRT